MNTVLQLSDLLELLGYQDTELVQIASAAPGGNFVTAVTPYPQLPGPNPGADCWFGVNPVMLPQRTDTDRSRNARPNADEVTRLAAVWADLDVKEGGCPDWDTAQAIIDVLSGMLGTRPVAVTYSGHGLQPYWAIEHQPIADETGPDDVDEFPIRRDFARALLRRWHRLIAAVAERHGAHVDSVFDLPRILRMPGSVNLKDPASPIPVMCFASDGAPIDVARLDEVLSENGVPIQPGDLDDPGAVVSPPEEWTWAASTCNYTKSMVSGWRDQNVTARHPWLLSQCVRIAAAHRYGCLTEAGRESALEVLITRFRELLATGDVRAEHPGEIAGAFADGQAIAAAKSEAQIAGELGNHAHRPTDRPPVVVSGPAPAAPGVANAGPGAPGAGAAAPAVQGAGDPRPIEHFGSELIFADHLRASLGTGPSSGVFRYGDTLALLRSITEAGYVKPSTPEALTEPERLVQLNGDRLSCYLQEQIFYTRLTPKGEVVRAYPPLRPVKEVVSLPSSAVSARITTGVTRTPSIRIDGSILDRAGYDPESGIIYLPIPGMEDIDVPEHPTRIDAIAAGVALARLVSDFGFITPHDRANYLAGLITPALQPLLDGPAPLLGVSASNQGSGKTLLSAVIAHLYGVTEVRGPLPSDDDEIEKQLGAIWLNSADPVVVFDNQTGIVRTGKLAALTTSRIVSVRKLGESTNINMTNNRLIVLNGNNLTFGGDLVRRVVMVRFDPALERAWERPSDEFLIPELAQHVMTNRPAILTAVLTMLRAWIVADRPNVDYASHGGDTFTSWRRIVRGVLAFAGIDGEVWTEATSVVDTNPDNEELSELLRLVHEVFGEQLWTVEAVLNRLTGKHFIDNVEVVGVEWDQVLPEGMVDRFTGVNRRALGKYLARHAGHWAGGRRIVSAGRDGHTKSQRYSIEQAGAS